MAAKRQWQSLATVVRASIQGELGDSVQARERVKFLAAFGTLAPSGETRSRRRRFWRRAKAPLRYVVAVAVLTVVLVLSVRRKMAPIALTYHVTGAVADGEYLQSTDAMSSAEVSFSDGSRIRLEPTTSARITGVSPYGAHLVLERGVLDVDVVHRVGAAWTIEAGPYEVAITGTAFSMGWDSDELTVAMTRGNVVVKGPLATSGVSVLAGERLSARQHDHSLSVVEQAGAAPNPLERQGNPASAPAPSEEPAPRPSVHAPSQSWSTRVASGEYASVLREAEEKGLNGTLTKSPVGDLAALADAARYLRRNDIARLALDAERSRFPYSSEAHAAAFLLARLVEDEGDIVDAVKGYDRYLRESPRGSFAQEALGRELALLWGRGDRAAALPVAERYLREFPLGPYTHIARDVTNEP